MNFVDAVKVMELLPEAWIPAMEEPEEPKKRSREPMTPAPSQTMAPATATSSVATKRPLPRAAKPIGLPHDVVMAERESSDVEVEELLPRYPKSKGKGCMDATEVLRLTKKTVDSTGACQATLPELPMRTRDSLSPTSPTSYCR